jgi:hypothetical protein
VEKWKVLPNYWLNQAGAKWGLETKILTAKLTPKLKKSINKIKFPLFWKQALKDWFKNPPAIDPAELEATEILNQNLWHNPLITARGETLDLPAYFIQQKKCKRPNHKRLLHSPRLVGRK